MKDSSYEDDKKHEREIITRLKANDKSLWEINFFISDSNAEEFSNALMRNTTVQKLCLESSCSDKRITLLAKALKFNVGVRDLTLSSDFESVEIKSLVEAIIGNSTLTHLRVDFHTMNEEYVSDIAKIVRKNKNLRVLYLNHVDPQEDTAVPINEHGIEMLTSELKHNTSLIQFYLINNPLSIISAEDIADVIKRNVTLELLKLHTCDLNDAAVKVIAEALKVNDHMMALDLPRNKIGDEGVGYIAGALVNNKKLIVLNLSENQITALGAKKISVALEVNSSLRELVLSRNELKKEGLLFIVEALIDNKKFRLLDVSGINAGSEGAELIGYLLALNNSLESLLFDDNEVGKEGAKFIAEGLMYNTHLRILGLGEREIPLDGIKAIALALKKNTTLFGLMIRQYERWHPEQLSCLKDAVEKNVSLMHVEGLSQAIHHEVIDVPGEVKEIDGFLVRNNLNRMKNMALLFKAYSFPKEDPASLNLLGKDILLMILAMVYPELTPYTFQRLRHSKFFPPCPVEKKENVVVQVITHLQRGCSIM